MTEVSSRSRLLVLKLPADVALETTKQEWDEMNVLTFFTSARTQDNLILEYCLEMADRRCSVKKSKGLTVRYKQLKQPQNSKTVVFQQVLVYNGVEYELDCDVTILKNSSEAHVSSSLVPESAVLQTPARGWWDGAENVEVCRDVHSEKQSQYPLAFFKDFYEGSRFGTVRGDGKIFLKEGW